MPMGGTSCTKYLPGFSKDGGIRVGLLSKAKHGIYLSEAWYLWLMYVAKVLRWEPEWSDSLTVSNKQIQRWNRWAASSNVVLDFWNQKKLHPSGKRSSLSHCHREPHVLTHFTGLIYSRNSEPLKWKEGCISLTTASMITRQGHTVPLSPRLLQRDHYLLASTYTEGKKISKPLALKSWQTRMALWISSEWQPYDDQMINILIRISLPLGPVKPCTYLVVECSWNR